VKALAALLAAAAAALGGSAPARVQIVAREYSFTLSRLHVKAGETTLELANFGEDLHDLRLQRAGARHVAAIASVAPGEHADVTLTLAPGRYSIWCSVADHRLLGMRATLVVTR
jgi:plastocyanin